MTDSICILFADADPKTRGGARAVLEEAGYTVVLAENGCQALELLLQTPLDLAVLDAALPGQDGLEVCRQARAQLDLPLLVMLPARRAGAMPEAIAAGASDCLVKPLRQRELLGRARVLLGRYAARKSAPRRIYKVGELALDVDHRLLSMAGENVPLSSIEFRLLYYFMERAGQTVQKDALLRAVWGYDISSGNLNLVDSAIRRLRKLIEDDPGRPAYLHTVWGTGYRFEFGLDSSNPN